MIIAPFGIVLEFWLAGLRDAVQQRGALLPMRSLNYRTELSGVLVFQLTVLECNLAN